MYKIREVMKEKTSGELIPLYLISFVTLESSACLEVNYADYFPRSSHGIGVRLLTVS